MVLRSCLARCLVTAIDDCPPIADGDGSVVTARFVTREVHVVASVDVLGADGTVETITGTTIHPVWSVDRQEWVPLAELTDGTDQNSAELPDGSGFYSSLSPPASGLLCLQYRFVSQRLDGALRTMFRPSNGLGYWNLSLIHI